MHSVTFDTLHYAKMLESRDVPKEQAEAHAELLAQILDARVTYKQETNEVVNRLSGDIAWLRQEQKSSFSDVKAEIIKWVFGISFGQAALILSILKFFH